ncbi:hypothetical protein ACIGNX_29930 [Actinosynnema sp. NPDC053489]|uniref:hypothetical protein n=1 Tax=Actinosynnema sp. NPDC053489 TaxID=3363916 RepID=UPI0037C6B6F0
MVSHKWQTGVDTAGPGVWAVTPQIIDGHGGVGPVAVGNAPGPRDGVAGIPQPCVVVAKRNRGGGISMNIRIGPDLGYGTWYDTGGYTAGDIAVTSDANGWVFAFAITGDGKLMIKHQNSSGCHEDVNGANWSDSKVVGG